MEYLKDMQLAGFFIWAIDLDDFNGDFCGHGSYPMLRYMENVLDGNIV